MGDILVLPRPDSWFLLHQYLAQTFDVEFSRCLDIQVNSACLIEMKEQVKYYWNCYVDVENTLSLDSAVHCPFSQPRVNFICDKGWIPYSTETRDFEVTWQRPWSVYDHRLSWLLLPWVYSGHNLTEHRRWYYLKQKVVCIFHSWLTLTILLQLLRPIVERGQCCPWMLREWLSRTFELLEKEVR